MRLPTRLALIGVVTLAATLGVVGVLSYEIVRVSGRQDVDRTLRQALDDVAAGFPALIDDEEALTPDVLRQAAQQYLAAHPGSARHLTLLAFGNDEFSTREGPELLVELREQDQLPAGRLGRLRTVDTDEGPVRVLAAPLVAGGEVIGRATIAGPLDAVRDAARKSLGRIAVAGAVGLVLGGAVLVGATRRALAPMEQLAEVARATGGGDLDARAPTPDRDDEVGALALEFNRMLERLSAHAEQRRRLLAAVSHELRTPLAVAQGHLEVFEVVGGGSADPGQTDALVATLRVELDRLGRIVDDLGALAEGDQGLAVEMGPVFAPDVLTDLGHRLAGLGLGAVLVGSAPPVVVEADEARLAQSLLNLVMNGVVHTPPGTRVRVEGRLDGAEMVFSVADDGPGVAPAVRDVAFEPFVTTRADGSGRGAGLGLAVVKTLTEAQSGRVELETGDAGTTVSIRLPVAALP